MNVSIAEQWKSRRPQNWEWWKSEPRKPPVPGQGLIVMNWIIFPETAIRRIGTWETLGFGKRTKGSGGGNAGTPSTLAAESRRAYAEHSFECDEGTNDSTEDRVGSIPPEFYFPPPFALCLGMVT
jgi:hypothetical protein